MGFGGVAKEALSKAVEVYEGLAKLSASLEQLNLRFADYRDEARKRQDSHEARTDRKSEIHESRIEEKLHKLESRFEGRCEALEARMRELERELSRIDGKISAAVSEALKIVFQKGAQDMRDGHSASEGARLGEGTLPPQTRLESILASSRSREE